MTEFQKAVVILDGCFDIEYKYKREIVDNCAGAKSLIEFANLSVKYLSKKFKNFDFNSFVNRFTEKEFLHLIESYKQKGITVICEGDEYYPQEFYNVSFSPICLYLKGNIKLLKSKNKLSIVGSRKTLPSILKITEDYSKRLSESGVVIVTGVAGGGDLSAVKGAIESGNLICILACGFDNAYREYSREFIKKAENKGLVITEHAPSVVAMPYYYPIRNRLIAGLSKGTLVISGNKKSGTRYTYNFALEYGKEVFAFPYGIGIISGEICNEIIKNGGYLVTEIEDITEVLGFSIKEKPKVLLSNNEIKVLQAIKEGKTLVDDVIEHTGLKVFEVLPTLTSLEIKNLIVKNGSFYSSIEN